MLLWVVGGRWWEAARALAPLKTAGKAVNKAWRCGCSSDAVTRVGRVVWMGEVGVGRVLVGWGVSGGGAWVKRVVASSEQRPVVWGGS